MGNRRRRQRKFIKNLKAVLLLIGAIPVAFLIFINDIGKNIIDNHFASPEWTCTQTDTGYIFAFQGTFNGVNLRPDRQFLVEYKQHIVSIIPVKGFYAEGYLSFGNRTSMELGANRADEADLLRALKDGILEKTRNQYGAETAEVVASRLLVYSGMLGGVAYKNKQGGDLKNQAIIEQDGIILNYSKDDEVIAKRLCESEVALDARLSAQDQKEELDWLIDTAAKDIQKVVAAEEQGRFLGFLKTIGKGLLVAIALVAIVFLLFWRYPVSWPLLNRIFAGGKWHQYVLAVAIGILLLIPVAQAKTLKRDEKLVYIERNYTVQRPVEDLFTPQQPEEVEEKWPPAAVLQRLHIPKNLVGVALNQAMLDHYAVQFEPIYKNGRAVSPVGPILPKWIDLDTFPYDAMDNTAAESIYAEGEKCKNSRPACLYHLDRALVDVVLTHPEFDFEVLFNTAADAVAAGEQFLTYNDRNIADDNSIIKNAGDIALSNGKVYWTLANYLEIRDMPEEYEGYVNCFYVAGFQCVKCGRDQTDQENPIYAMLTYYMGNFSEKMLARISKETQGEFYDRIGEEALLYYEEAQMLLEQRPDIYLMENRMSRNIQSGINTLHELGFES